MMTLNTGNGELAGNKHNIAVQLYNFRGILTKEFRDTLREIAGMGFDGVEFAGYYGDMAPKKLADFLGETGLKCAGCMFPADALKKIDDEAYRYASLLQTPAVTISSKADFEKMFQDVVDTFTVIGNNAAAHGLRFSYHNHWWELAKCGDTTALEVVLAATDPEKVFIEPDVCWLHRAGIDPVQFLEKYCSRIKQVHLKDIVIPEKIETTTELGKGIIGISRIIKSVSALPGDIWMIYEQDHTADPFKSAAESLEFIRKNIS